MALPGLSGSRCKAMLQRMAVLQAEIAELSPSSSISIRRPQPASIKASRDPFSSFTSPLGVRMEALKALKDLSDVICQPIEQPHVSLLAFGATPKLREGVKIVCCRGAKL